MRHVILCLLPACLTVIQGLCALEVPLHVREFQGIPRRAEMVTLGVAFQPGEMPDVSPLAVAAPSGEPVPAQFRTTAVWPDGSARWVLVNFVADCTPNGHLVYRLSDSAAAAEYPQLDVQEQGDRLVIDTGVMRCVLDRGHCDLFSEVWLDHDGDGEFGEDELVTVAGADDGILLRDAVGRELAARWGEVERFEVESKGPLRATVVVRGSLFEPPPAEPWLDYTAQIHFQAGSGLVRVLFTLENDNPTLPLEDEDGDRSHWVLGRRGSFFFDDLSLTTRLAFSGPIQLSAGDGREDVLDRMVVTGMGGVYQESSGGENWFHRNHMNHVGKVPLTFRGAKYFLDGTDAYSRNRPDAWLHASDRTFGLAVAIRHFWQNFPNCLSVSRDGTVRVALWPGEFQDHHELQGGEFKTHELAFFFHTGPQGSTREENIIATRMAAFHHPLYARAPAADYLASGHFDDAAVYDPERFPTYESLQHGAIMNEQDNLVRDIETIDEYGWRNFGDTWAKNERTQTRGTHHGRIALSHYNHEYDHGYGMLFQSVRTADRAPDISYAWWKLAEAANRHQSDIDIYHSLEDDLRGGVHNGGKFTHTQHGAEPGLATHRGGGRPHWFGSLRWPWGEGSNPESGHFDNRGMISHYYMTGERQTLRSALEMADLVHFKITENRFPQIGSVNRDAGNNLQTLLEAWMHTWDDRYREAAEKVLVSTHPDSQWYTTEAGIKANPGKTVSGFWTAAICIDNAARFTQIMELETGERYELGREYVTRYADFLSTFLAGGPEVGYHRSWSPSGGGDGNGYGPWTYRIADISMWGHKLTDDPQLRKRCLRAARDAFACMRSQYPGNGWIYTSAKPNTMMTGGGHEYTGYIQNNGWE